MWRLQFGVLFAFWVAGSATARANQLTAEQVNQLVDKEQAQLRAAAKCSPRVALLMLGIDSPEAAAMVASKKNKTRMKKGVCIIEGSMKPRKQKTPDWAQAPNPPRLYVSCKLTQEERDQARRRADQLEDLRDRPMEPSGYLKKIYSRLLKKCESYTKDSKEMDKKIDARIRQQSKQRRR